MEKEMLPPYRPRSKIKPTNRSNKLMITLMHHSMAATLIAAMLINTTLNVEKEKNFIGASLRNSMGDNSRKLSFPRTSGCSHVNAYIDPCNMQRL